MSDELKIHPRHIPTAEARKDLSMFLLAWRAKHHLTEAEYFSLLLSELHGEASLLVKSERKDGDDDQ